MSISNNWLCYYNGEAHLEQLVVAEDPEAAVRWFIAHVELAWDADCDPIYVWVRPAGLQKRGSRLFVAERPQDPPRAVYEVRL